MHIRTNTICLINRGLGANGDPAFRESFAKLGELRSIVKEGEECIDIQVHGRCDYLSIVSLLNYCFGIVICLCIIQQ